MTDYTYPSHGPDQFSIDDNDNLMSEVEMSNPYKHSDIPLENMDYGASLPLSSEELRTTASTSFTFHNGTSDDDDVDHHIHDGAVDHNKAIVMDDHHNDTRYSKKKIVLYSVLIALFIVMIGLIVGIPLKKSKNTDNNTVTLASPEPREVDITTLRTYLLENYNIKTMNETSPQYIAARFMAQYDLYNMKLPGYSNGGDPLYDNEIYAYRFLARYVMILNYFSLGGSVVNGFPSVQYNNIELASTWYNKLQFLTEYDICDWRGYVIGLRTIETAGVFCASFVSDTGGPPQLVPISLALKYNNLTGTIPTEMGLLTTLGVMDYQFNFNITGSIPTELCQLTNLRSFFLGYNAFTGSIPDCIGDIAGLLRIFLSNNQLTGTLPPSMFSLLSLERLILDDNHLEKNPLLLLKNMKNLTMLILNNNHFTGYFDNEFISSHEKLYVVDVSTNNFKLSKDNDTIPTSLFQLTDLVVLDLSKNNISGSLPNDIPSNTMLGYLALYNNDVSGTIPSSIRNLSNLVSFDISENSLSGDIPDEIQYIKNLSLLFLSNNNFNRGPIPTWLSTSDNNASLLKLEQLSIRNTNRNGTIPPELGTLTNLNLLDVSNNQLSGPVPLSLSSLKKLQFLLMNNNTLLNGTISNVFGQTNSLRAIFVDGTSFQDNFDSSLCQLTNFLPANDDGEVIFADCKGERQTITCKTTCCTCCDAANNAGCSKPALDNLDGKWELSYERSADIFLNGTAYVASDFSN